MHQTNARSNKQQNTCNRQHATCTAAADCSRPTQCIATAHVPQPGMCDTDRSGLRRRSYAVGLTPSAFAVGHCRRYWLPLSAPAVVGAGGAWQRRGRAQPARATPRCARRSRRRRRSASPRRAARLQTSAARAQRMGAAHQVQAARTYVGCLYTHTDVRTGDGGGARAPRLGTSCSARCGGSAWAGPGRRQGLSAKTSTELVPLARR